MSQLSTESRGWVRGFVQTAGLRLLTLPVTAGLSALSAAVAVHYAGERTYGYLSSIAQITFLIPFADLGLGAAVTRAVARMSTGPVEYARALGLVHRTIQILTVVGLISAVVVAIVGVFHGWSTLFNAPARLASGVDRTASIALGVFFILLPLATGQRILIGQDRSALLVGLGTIPPAVNLLFILVGGAAGVEPINLALGTTVASVLTVAAYAGFAFLPSLRGIGIRTVISSVPHRSMTGSVMRAAVPMLFSALGVAAAVQPGRIVLAAAGDASALAAYSLTFQLYLPLYSVIYMASTVLWPRFAVRHDKRLWQAANVLFTGLGFAAGVGIVVVGPWLVGVLSDGTIQLNITLVLSFAALLTVQGAHSTQSMLMTSATGLRVQAGFAVLAGVLALIVSVGLTPNLGAAGPALGASCGLLVGLVVPCFLYSRRILRNRVVESE
jgi:O-antigen/teichoic acid export membrane protein